MPISAGAGQTALRLSTRRPGLLTNRHTYRFRFLIGQQIAPAPQIRAAAFNRFPEVR
jgi:hypothetical protein